MTQNRSLILIIAVLVVLAVALPLLTWSPWIGYAHGMMGMMGYGFWFVGPILVLALIAVGAYYLITGFAATGRRLSGDWKRPLDILKERYAKGEISEEQYLKMKQELRS